MTVPETPRLGTLAVAGVGLIGGSVALSARERGLADLVIGFDHDAVTLDAALGMGAIDEARLEPGDWLRQVDLLVLAAPTKSLPAMATALLPHLGAGAVVTDVGSVKRSVTDAVGAISWPGGGGRFVGGHPMAGSERAGVLNADPGLLENAIWVLTPGDDVAPDTLDLVRSFVEALGARPLVTTPDKHDELVAAVSHLPYLAAVALTTLVDEGDDRGLKSLLAAGGFRDLTRVASGDPRMSRDMIADNAGPVRSALRSFRSVLDELESVLEDSEALLERAQAAKRARDAVPVVKRGLLASRWELVVAVLDRPGEFARITAALAEASVNIKDLEVLSVRESGGAVRLAFEDPSSLAAGRAALEAAGYSVRSRNGG